MSTLSSQAPSASGFDRRWLILTVTTIGTFMSILDSTVLNIALPTIMRDFHVDVSQGQLVVTVYLLALAIVIPLSGFLADRAGIKRVYMITLFLFTAGSAFCGLAWNLPSLIAFRVLQGLGGGMLQPLGLAILYTTITPLERGRFMALIGLPALLAPILGPTVGGYLVEYSTWRAIFLINLPFGVLNFGLAYWLLKERARRPELRLDRRGFVLSIIAFPALLVALSTGEDSGWGSSRVLVLFTVGIVALITFIFVELRQRDPLLELRLLARPVFALGMVLQFTIQFSLFGLQLILPLFLQTAHGLSPAQTGLALLPMGIAAFTAMNISGRLYNRIGPRPLVISGLLILLVATALLSRTTAETGVLPIVILANFRGLAMGLCMMPTQTFMFNTVPDHLISRGTALTQVSFRIFGTMSTAVLSLVLVLSLSWHGAPEGSSIIDGTAPLNFMSYAFDDVFLLMTALTVVGIALALFVHDPVLEEVHEKARIKQQPVAGPD